MTKLIRASSFCASRPCCGTRAGAQNDVLEVDNFQVDRNSFGIRLEGRRLDLTTTEFKLLAALIERRGRISLDRVCSMMAIRIRRKLGR